jgi:hypothetical protein
MQVQEIDFRTAKAFIETHHYSHVMPRGRSRCFGYFIDGGLFAVANYGVGVNMVGEDFLAKATGLPVTADNLFELKRLCRLGDARQAEVGKWDVQNKHPLSQFLSACHKILRYSMPPVIFVVSFSDPEHSHLGGIYKASNFISFGSTRCETHYKGRGGEFIHRRIPYRRMQKYNISKAIELLPAMMEKECEAIRIQSGKPKATMEIKHRAAKKILGSDAQTFRYSWQHWHYEGDPAGQTEPLKERVTLAKSRWFLPLLPDHRNWLEKNLKLGNITFDKQGTPTPHTGPYQG